MKKFAYSSLCCKYIDDVLSLSLSNSYNALEWDLNFIPPTLSASRVAYISQFISEKHVEIRYHLPYSYIEIAHIDSDIRDYSITSVKRHLDFIHKLGGEYAVLHVGYSEFSDINVALRSIEEIACYAKSLRIYTCIENLTKGLTTDAKFLKAALQIDNVNLCLDTGHADVISKNHDGYWNELSKLLNTCIHSHVYRTEDKSYNHVAFKNEDEVKDSEIIRNLFATKCDWFTMELDDVSKQINQCNLLSSSIIL